MTQKLYKSKLKFYKVPKSATTGLGLGTDRVYTVVGNRFNYILTAHTKKKIYFIEVINLKNMSTCARAQRNSISKARDYMNSVELYGLF